jgi:hypothetical protein
MLHSCDLFGQDEPKSKATQFSFQLDTLKGITGSFEDLYIFDDTSFVIVGRFYDSVNDTSFNQINWTKKTGLKNINIQLKDVNRIIYSGLITSYNKKYNTEVYTTFASYTIINGSNISFYDFDLFDNEFSTLLGTEFINETDFYIYGKNGVLGLHKNGAFHRIETNTDLDFTHAVWHGDSLLVYGLTVYDTFKSEQAGLFVVKDTIATTIDRWGYEQENKKPFYSNTLLWEDGAYYFFGQEGIYRYENQQFEMEEFLLMGHGKFDSRNEGVFHLYDHIYLYSDKKIFNQNFGLNKDSTLIFINPIEFKNNLIIAVNLNLIIIGTR